MIKKAIENVKENVKNKRASKIDEEIRLLKLRGDKLTIENTKLRKESIAVSDVNTLLSELATSLKNKLLQIPKRTAPVLASMNQAREIEAYLTQEINTALRDLNQLNDSSKDEENSEETYDDDAP